MTTQPLAIYDPAMCCPTGVCGAEVDARLARFAADLDHLAAMGVTLRRFNLAQDPGAFAADAAVRQALEAAGKAALPLIKAGDDVVCQGRYPTRAELATWAGLEASAGVYTEAVDELVAIGAAIASNCKPCFKFHAARARELGVSREDMRRAVATAQRVKETPARRVLDLAERVLEGRAPKAAVSDVAASAAPAGGCCASSTEPAPSSSEESEGGCCGASKASAAPPSEPREAGCCRASKGPHADRRAAGAAGGPCGPTSPKTQGSHAPTCC